MEADSGPFRHALSALSISLSVFSLGIVYLLHSFVPPSPLPLNPFPSDPVQNVIVATNSYTDY